MKTLIIILIVVVISVGGVILTLSFVDIDEQLKSMEISKARQMCIENQTIGALEHLQQRGSGDTLESYIYAQEQLIIFAANKCNSSYLDVNLILHAEEGLFDIPRERLNELRENCKISGGHWDIGCRFGESNSNKNYGEFFERFVNLYT